MPDRSNLRGEGFTMAHILRVQAIELVKTWPQEHVAAVRVAPMVRSSVWLLAAWHPQSGSHMSYIHIYHMHF